MSFTVAQAARMYRVPLLDYGEGRRGVLISSGCGIMLGLMDATRLRWCVDADAIRGSVSDQNLASFCALAHRAEGLCLAGWFSYSDPAPLMAAVEEAERHTVAPCLVYAGHRRLGALCEFDSLQALVAALHSPNR